MRTLISGGTVVTPDEASELNILIEGGRIAPRADSTEEKGSDL